MSSMTIPTFSEWTYDVFLSFRGADTRTGFAGNLYNALHEKGINIFMDDQELEKGEEITPSLMNAIKNSKIAIVVFSANYASSSFCLEELVSIMECVNDKGRLVWPVFYQVDPCDVRHQKGSYEEALAMHERKNNDKERVKRWRFALYEAANLSGWHFKHGYEYEFIRKMVQEVSKEINRSPLYVAKYPVGLESRMQKIASLIDVELSDQVHMVGIYGMGGIGKTTLACAVYNFIVDKFESFCFLADIRENSVKHGLVQLQETLLSDLVGEKDAKWWNVNKGIPIIKNRLCRKKVLLILDDVDKLEQLEALAGELDWFGSGSRVIITTRDKHLLHVYGVEKTYEVEGLNHKEAIELFSLCAFKGKEDSPSYMDILKRVVLYSNGLPLSLEIIGSDLFGKTMAEWNSAVDTYERIPHQNVQGILRVSYDGLKEFEKEIFLDIACFFKGYKLSDVISILHSGRGSSIDYVIQVLIDKCLIKIVHCHVRIHDLIEDMGREIVRQESPLKPGERSRLWFSKDILHVFKENKGSDKTEIIMLNRLKDKEVQWDGNAFKKMENLKILVVENARFSRGPSHLPKSLRVLKWCRYPEPLLPPQFDPKKIVILDLCMSFFSFDNQLMVKFKSLSEMKLSGCKLLKQVPDLSGAPNLKKLNLDGCRNLVEVHDSIGFLHKLEVLNLDYCTSLKVLPRGINLTSLETLSLRICTSLKSFPEILGKMENTRYVYLNDSAIRELPFSIVNLVGLTMLTLSGCNALLELPSSLFMFPKLEILQANKCKGLTQIKKGKGHQETMPSNVRDASPFPFDKNASFGHCCLTDEFLATLLPCLHHVTRLYLMHNNITILPSCINACLSLSELYLDGCKELREIRGLPPNIMRLSAVNCISLTSQSKGMLMTQALHRIKDTCFCFPVTGSTIQSLFNHCSKGLSLSFWFRGEFPMITLCVVGALDSCGCCVLDLFVNGSQKFPGCFKFMALDDSIQTNHVILFNLQLQLLSDEIETSLYTVNGWNHAEISFSEKERTDVEWMGVYVKEQNTCMPNIRFTNPEKMFIHHINGSPKIPTSYGYV